ncbi:MAG: MinD/ParA family protein, partial [Methylococcaceae bacterium]|nr:MinD/ParA family protein [Methylococcaceae bacterium]
MQSRRPVRVLAVTSGKGGVGKTNVSVNLGTALAEFGHSVVLLDADMGLANIDVLLGLSPRYNFFHVLEGEKSLDEVMVKGPAGLMVVPGASGIQKMAELTTTEQAAVIRSFSEFDQEIDVLIVDTAAGISSGVVNFAKACQEVVVVVCDEPTSLTDAYAFIKLLNRDHGLCRFQVLTNMMSSAEQGQNLFAKLCKVT